MLYTPSKPHSVDIIFVHGLGGSSRKTWTLKNAPDTFWPQEWLPDEPEINTARILTFGYNADYKSRGPNNLSSISDFARALLFGMKFGKDGDDLNVGKVHKSSMQVYSSADQQRNLSFLLYTQWEVSFLRRSVVAVYFFLNPISLHA